MLIDRAPAPTPQNRNQFRTEPVNLKRPPAKKPSGSIRTLSVLKGAVAHRSGSGTDTPKQKLVPNNTDKLVRFSLVRFSLVRFSLVRFNLVRFGLVRFGLVSYEKLFLAVLAFRSCCFWLVSVSFEAQGLGFRV